MDKTEDQIIIDEIMASFIPNNLGIIDAVQIKHRSDGAIIGIYIKITPTNEIQ